MVDTAILSRPPLNVLIDPTLAKRKRPWVIHLTELLVLFVQASLKPESIDMRAAGTAVLSSATIYRLKVETLFLFERLRAERRLVDVTEPPQLIVMPFRYEVYSTNVEELFDELTRILDQIMVEGAEGPERNPLPMDDFKPPDPENYMISLQTIISEFRKILVERLRATGKTLLSELTAGLNPIDAARVFILLLFAAHSGEVVIEQEERDDDALVVSVGQLD